MYLHTLQHNNAQWNKVIHRKVGKNIIIIIMDNFQWRILHTHTHTHGILDFPVRLEGFLGETIEVLWKQE